MHGTQNEVIPLCVMDFYVHHSRQRNGCGKKLFEHMLKVWIWIAILIKQSSQQYSGNYNYLSI